MPNSLGTILPLRLSLTAAGAHSPPVYSLK